MMRVLCGHVYVLYVLVFVDCENVKINFIT